MSDLEELVKQVGLYFKSRSRSAENQAIKMEIMARGFGLIGEGRFNDTIASIGVSDQYARSVINSGIAALKKKRMPIYVQIKERIEHVMNDILPVSCVNAVAALKDAGVLPKKFANNDVLQFLFNRLNLQVNTAELFGNPVFIKRKLNKSESGRFESKILNQFKIKLAATVKNLAESLGEDERLIQVAVDSYGEIFELSGGYYGLRDHRRNGVTDHFVHLFTKMFTVHSKIERKNILAISRRQTRLVCDTKHLQDLPDDIVIEALIASGIIRMEPDKDGEGEFVKTYYSGDMDMDSLTDIEKAIVEIIAESNQLTRNPSFIRRQLVKQGYSAATCGVVLPLSPVVESTGQKMLRLYPHVREEFLNGLGKRKSTNS